jgi:hypothetical protein
LLLFSVLQIGFLRPTGIAKFLFAAVNDTGDGSHLSLLPGDFSRIPVPLSASLQASPVAGARYEDKPAGSIEKQVTYGLEASGKNLACGSLVPSQGSDACLK